MSLEYKGLAETTIIMLHVEARVHCFFHLAVAVKVQWSVCAYVAMYMYNVLLSHMSECKHKE